VKAQDFNVDDKFGSAIYKELQWAGEISFASLEV